jgi:hypothetical protein
MDEDDLPGTPMPPRNAKPASGAEVVEDGAGRESTPADAGSAGGPKVDENSEAGTVIDWHARLGDELKRVYGKQPRRTLGEKALLLYSYARKDVPPLKSFKEIGPVEAETIVEYIMDTWPVGGGGPAVEVAASQDAKPDAPTTASPAYDDHQEGIDPRLSGFAETLAAMPPDDGPPPMDDPEADRLADEAFGMTRDSFLAHVARERKRLKGDRPLVKEAPPGSGRFYVTDPLVLKEAGYDASLCIQKDGMLQVHPSELMRLAKIITAQADAAESGRRA